MELVVVVARAGVGAAVRDVVVLVGGEEGESPASLAISGNRIRIDG